MSGQTPNFFAVLSEPTTTVGSGAVHLKSTPTTASTTSSKKSDVNPRADPSRAKPKAPAAPSNDRTLKESRSAGRANNKNVPVTQGASSHRSRRAQRTDRVDRTGKHDTAKRTRSGWGDKTSDAKDQVVGAEIAEEAVEANEDTESGGSPAESVPAAPQITFDEYMRASREQAEALNTRKPSAKSSSPVVTPTPATSAPEPRKKHSNKARKEPETLELDSSSAPPLLRQSEDRDSRKTRGNPRPRSSGPRKFNRRSENGKTENGKLNVSQSPELTKRSNKPAININELPKLN